MAQPPLQIDGLHNILKVLHNKLLTTREVSGSPCIKIKPIKVSYSIMNQFLYYSIIINSKCVVVKNDQISIKFHLYNSIIINSICINVFI